MTDRLEDLLRDPRAHGDPPDAAEVRGWGEAALARWRAETSARGRRWSWQDAAMLAGVVTAVAALAPALGALLGRLWPALEEGAGALASASWTEALAEAPPLLLAAVPLLVFLSVPQLRDRISRLLDA